MIIQTVQLDPIRVAMIRHSGSYEAIPPVFEKLFGWVEAEGVSIQRTIGLYWDNPEYVAEDDLRSAAAVEISAATQVNDPQGLGIETFEVPGGLYAMTRFVGPYEELEKIWSKFAERAERKAVEGVLETPALEMYMNDPADTPPDQLITELYMPIE